MSQCEEDLLSIYVVQDEAHLMFSVLGYKILAYPVYKVVLECSLDQLVKQIWRDHLIDVAAWEVRSEWLKFY